MLWLDLEFCKICHSEALFVPQGLSRSLKVFLIEGIAEESALKQQILSARGGPAGFMAGAEFTLERCKADSSLRSE